jgi:hypothetical protein
MLPVLAVASTVNMIDKLASGALSEWTNQASTGQASAKSDTAPGSFAAILAGAIK